MVSACGRDAASRALVRDSAGVTIVELSIPDDPPTLELVPLDTLGDSPDDVLFEVRGAAFLPDGGLAVGTEGVGRERWRSPARARSIVVPSRHGSALLNRAS